MTLPTLLGACLVVGAVTAALALETNDFSELTTESEIRAAYARCIYNTAPDNHGCLRQAIRRLEELRDQPITASGVYIRLCPTGCDEEEAEADEN